MKVSKEIIIKGKKYPVTSEDCKKCMIADAQFSRVIFLYDHSLWNQTEKVNSAFVCGTFNSWAENPDFQMTFLPEFSLHYLAVDFSQIRETGNSGHPEYKFCVNGNYVSLEGKGFIPETHIFPSYDKNLLIPLPDDDINAIIRENRIAGKVKKLSDFNLESRLGQEEISNFRLVPGTKKLFRSFHPFYSTNNRSEIFESEKKRLEFVQKLSEEEGIKSDINLTDDYTIFAGQEVKWIDGSVGKVEIPSYYQKILDSKSVCNVMSKSGIVPSYEYVYNYPRHPLVSEWFQVIVNFIIDDAHSAPFQIHCAIGTDRTGVFCALLGALCGAKWEELAEDYEKTNRMGILEYRSRSLLAKSLQKLLDVNDISKVRNLQKAVKDYFTKTELNGRPILSEEQIEKLVKKLSK